MKSLEQDINDALSMVDTFRDRALKAEFELRKLKRAIQYWNPVGVTVSTIDDNKTLLVATVRGVFPHDKAYSIAKKLGQGEI